jgi:membrane associated rhomboid family serine protease
VDAQAEAPPLMAKVRQRTYTRLMGLYDRGYMHEPARGRGFGFSLAGISITGWLIGINVAVFLVDRLLQRAGWSYVLFQGPAVVGQFGVLELWGHFSVSTAVKSYQVWRFLTFQFLHADLEHLIFNMLSLFFFGPIVESYLGARRFLPFYLLCGIGGVAMYLILWMVGLRSFPDWVPLVGASAGIFGILIAAARVAPSATVMFMMIFPMPLRTLAWLFIAYAIWIVISKGQNAGGEAAHLGGAAVGWLLMHRPGVLDRLMLPKMGGRRFRGTGL